MKISIIRPSVLYKEVAVNPLPTAPLGPAYIAAVLKNLGHEVKAIDAAVEGYHRAEPFRFDTFIVGLNKRDTIALIEKDTEVICFSFMFSKDWYFNIELVEEARLKFPDAIIIAGGEHVTAVPEYCLNTAAGLDYIVMGEGEATIVDLMECIEKKQAVDDIGRIAYRKDGIVTINNHSRRIKHVEEIDKIPWPAWELFPLNKYFDYRIGIGVYRGNSLPVLASRGCPYDCTFCSSPQMYGKLYKVRDIQDFVNELEHYNKNYNVTNFDFYDLTAIVYRDWIIELCDEILKRGLKITYQIPSGTRAEAIDSEVAGKLYQSGCKNISYAPESGSPVVLKAIRKRVNIESMLNSIKHSAKAGMNVKLNIIVGLPGETYANAFETIWFLIKASWCGAKDAYPNNFSPYPGSMIYEKMVKDGKVDIYDQSFVQEMIDTHNLLPAKNYNDKMSLAGLRIYSLAVYLAFYGSNFLFRPQRLVRMIRNLVTRNHESRSEQVIDQTLRRLNWGKPKTRIKSEAEIVTG